MRYSRQRELILNTLKSVHSHPTADSVYEMVRRKEPNISMGTVYRNLNDLAVKGEITVLQTNENKLRFDGDTDPHKHFICKECGKIIDIYVKTELPSEIKKADFTVEEERTVYYGLCGECQAKHKKLKSAEAE